LKGNDMTKHTLGEVKIALDGIGDPDAAMSIVRTTGGVARLSMLPPDKFDAVIREANARARRSDAPLDAHPANKASRSVNEEAARYWQDRKTAREAGEPAPLIPADPGQHNEKQLEKLGGEADQFREFVNGAPKDV
jgi:hypothetical protein